MHPLLLQIINNGTILAIAMILVGFALKGFFWKFIRVKASFGKFVMCKIREVNRDKYRVGHISEGFLIYKEDKKNDKRIAISQKDVFYRSIGITWVDIDSEKNALVQPNFETVTGYDAVKYSDLYKRCLYKPTISEFEQMFRMFIIILVLVLIVCGIGLFFNWQLYNKISTLPQVLDALANSVKATVPASGI